MLAVAKQQSIENKKAILIYAKLAFGKIAKRILTYFKKWLFGNYQFLPNFYVVVGKVV